MRPAGKNLHLDQVALSHIGRPLQLRPADGSADSHHDLGEVPDHFVQSASDGLVQREVFATLDANLVALNGLANRYVARGYNPIHSGRDAHLGPYRKAFAAAVAYIAVPQYFRMPSGRL